MVVDAAREGAGRHAAEIAAIVTERGLGGDDVDLGHRLDGLRRDRSRRAEEARAMARRWAEFAGTTPPRPASAPPSPGAILALAYPDRIAKSRGGGTGGFLLANGRGANVDPALPLAREPFLAVAEIIGSAAQGRVVLAAPIALAEIETRFADRIEAREETVFDPGSLSLRTRRLRRLGALTLAEQPVAVAADEAAAHALAAGIAKLGLDRLPWTKALAQWRDRVQFLRRASDLGSTRDRHSIVPKSAKADLGGEEWPDLSDAGLAACVEDWLTPALLGKTAIAQLGADELGVALSTLLPHALRRRLDSEAPTHFEAPSGSRVAIDYDGEEGPKLAIRVQELFGLARHPTIAGGRVPLVIELLSPAHRPVQVTRDLPGFWRGSYAAVRSEMRGRYPRHPWPDDPLAAPATRRAKPRGR
jgi:ATP-dependent helicase HrpB